MKKRRFLIWQLIVVASVLILLAILGMAIWVITHPDLYDPPVVWAAVGAVFGEILCAMLFVWKTTANPAWNEPIQPTTNARPRPQLCARDGKVVAYLRKRSAIEAHAFFDILAVTAGALMHGSH